MTAGPITVTVDTSEFDAELEVVTAKLDRLEAIANAEAWAHDEAPEPWVCGRCDHGQCARCRDEDCACCNGNPDA